MSSTKIYPFNSLQLRLVNSLITRGNAGRKTDALAVQVGVSPSEVAFELLKLRELGYVSTVNDGSAYVTWYSSPGLVDALKRYTDSKIVTAECVTPVHQHPTQYQVHGPENYVTSTYACERDALREATRRAERTPGKEVRILVVHKTVVFTPEQRIPGELIIK
jgi:hypothetical protein